MEIVKEKIKTQFNRLLSFVSIVVSSTVDVKSRPLVAKYLPSLVITLTAVIIISWLVAVATWFEFKRQQHIEETLGDKIEHKIKKGQIFLPGFSREKMYERYDCAFNVFEKDIYDKTAEIISDCKNSQECHVVVLYKHIMENFKVIKADNINEKPLKQPLQTWRDKSGTTEDLCVLYAAMLYGLGHETNIFLSPKEAFVTHFNFKEDAFIEEIIRRYIAQYGIIKSTKIDLKPREKQSIKIENDFRYYPLTFDVHSTDTFSIRFYRGADEYRRFREEKAPFIDSEYNRNNISGYKQELYAEKGSIIIIENGESPATLTYIGYRKNDQEAHQYIKSLITVHKGDGSRYSCHAPLLFSLGENHLPGRETKQIADIRMANGIIEIPTVVMAKKYLRQVRTVVK